MTSKSIVSWGQQGGPPEAGRGGSHRLDSAEGALPVSHTRLRQFTTVAPQSQPGYLRIPCSYKLSRVLTAFPHSLLSTLGQVTDLLWACRGPQGRARRSQKGPQCPPHPQMSARGEEGMTHAETHSGFSRLFFLGAPCASRPGLQHLPFHLFPSYSFTENRYSFSPHLYLVSLTRLLPGLFPATSPCFFFLCPCPAPQEAQLFPCPPLCQFLPSGPPQLPPDRFCSPSRWHNQFAHF